MKKFKKVFAVLLTLAMVLGMSMTTFAATPATITVKGLDENATVTYKQIIQPNTSAPTGWEFVDKDDIKAFGDSYTADDEQAVIWRLIKMKSGNKPVTNMPAGTVAFTASEFQTAVGKIATTSTPTGTINNGTISWNVSEAGVYVVKAESKKDGKNTAYTYSPMAAYVSFGSYDTTTGKPSVLTDAEITAKSTTVEITKEDNENDKVVEVGKIVTYTATTKIPYVSANNNITSFKLIDTISGADYVTETAGENIGKVHVTGTVGTASIDQYVSVVDNSITVDLSTYLENNTYANATVSIQYQAKVTSIEVNNRIIPDDGKNTYIPAIDKLYTGTVTLTKTGENNAYLEGAKFVLKKGAKYALVSSADGVYSVTGWTDNYEDAKDDGNLMVTNSNGKIVVKGLDDSVNNYEFKEVVAPDGYSINETNATVSWATEGDGAQAATREGSASMTDTKLASLPGTGGIGTTIFTIGGCLIMIIAAALFFANRRKAK